MMATAMDEAQISRLVEAADKAVAADRMAEAAQLLREAQAVSPRHPLVLNGLGFHALRSADFATARRHFEEAVAADASAPQLWFHLALACRAQGDALAESAALEKALALDPYFYLARLQKATLLERQGKARQAAESYGAFLASVPPPAQQAPGLKQALERARAAIATNNAALEGFVRTRLAPVRAGQREGTQERFDHCLDALLGKRRIYTPQPTFLHFPRLPALEFYNRADFPWLEAFEAATDEIRSELMQQLSSDQSGVVPYVAHPPGVPLNQWKELNHSRRWGAYYLMKDGARVEEHLRCCPKTAALLFAAPLAEVPGQAPTAFFSILELRTRIPAHTGVTNTRLVVHLPLVVPPGCGFRVGSETREWKPGQAWVFDDTIEHEAWNDSDEPRAILIMDIWNPFLTADERALVGATTAAVAEYYRD